ncbi:MAG: hypothetical protein ACTHXA_00735 [Gulosibacter sp.]|uniref:hypothetical protein n=1 Tax=Gulosibacter sp. TaxID=2817531 RepID=UPI003F92444D
MLRKARLRRDYIQLGLVAGSMVLLIGVGAFAWFTRDWESNSFTVASASWWSIVIIVGLCLIPCAVAARVILKRIRREHKRD